MSQNNTISQFAPTKSFDITTGRGYSIKGYTPNTALTTAKAQLDTVVKVPGADRPLKPSGFFLEKKKPKPPSKRTLEKIRRRLQVQPQKNNFDALSCEIEKVGERFKATCEMPTSRGSQNSLIVTAEEKFVLDFFMENNGKQVEYPPSLTTNKKYGFKALSRAEYYELENAGSRPVVTNSRVSEGKMFTNIDMDEFFSHYIEKTTGSFHRVYSEAIDKNPHKMGINSYSKYQPPRLSGESPDNWSAFVTNELSIETVNGKSFEHQIGNKAFDAISEYTKKLPDVHDVYYSRSNSPVENKVVYDADSPYVEFPLSKGGKDTTKEEAVLLVKFSKGAFGEADMKSIVNAYKELLEGNEISMSIAEVAEKEPGLFGIMIASVAGVVFTCGKILYHQLKPSAPDVEAQN